MIRRICIVSSSLFAALLMGSKAHAQFLAERLVPPVQVTTAAVPMVSEPAAPRVFGADKPRLHLWALPFSPLPGTSVVLVTEQRPLNWFRPIHDTPVLASESDPVRPAYPAQPVSPRAYASAPSPSTPAPLARFPLPTEPIAVAADDPSATAAFTLLTASVPLAAPNSPELLRLSIPDPFEQIRTIRLTNTPADADEPATAQDRPPLAKLPMVEPPK